MADYSPMVAYKRAKKMFEDKRYLEALKFDLSPYIHADIIWRMENEQNFVAEIVGEPGTGKTEAGFSLSWELQNLLGHENLVLDNVSMTWTRALKLTKKYQSRWTFQIDEQKRDYYGEGSQREINAMRDLEDVVRMAQTNFIYVSPKSRVFHEGLHYIFRTWWLDIPTETNLLLVFEGDDNMLSRPLGYFEARRPRDPRYYEFLKDYREKLKVPFIKQSQAGETRMAYFETLKQYAREIITSKKHLLPETVNKKKMIAHTYLWHPHIASGLGVSELERVVDMALLLIETDK